MTWLGPALLFFGCVAGLLLWGSCKIVSAVDRIMEEQWRRHQEERTR